MVAVLMALLCWACSQDEASTTERMDAQRTMTIVAEEESWNGEDITVSLTRSGETLTGLKACVNPASPANGEGFGLYSTYVGLTNKQVVWDNAAWNYGNKILWPNNTVNATDFYAYAPYDTYANTDGRTFADETQANNAIIYVNGSTLTCKTVYRNLTDLLWADRSAESDGTVKLTFKHVMGMLRFGSITNNFDKPITLKRLVIQGTRYKQRNLNLTTGEWTNDGAVEDPTPINATRPYDIPAYGGGVVISAGDIINIPDMADIMQIPHETKGCTVTFVFSYNNSDISVSSGEIIIAKGKIRTINLIVGLNHEVVIQ